MRRHCLILLRSVRRGCGPSRVWTETDLVVAWPARRLLPARTNRLMPSVSSTNIWIVRVAIWVYERYLGSMTAFNSLQDFVDRHRRLFVLTGAGCSTSSGIPDYRDVDGNWKPAAGEVPGLHGRRDDATALLGAKFDRMAPFRSGSAQRCPSRTGPVRDDGAV